MGYVEMVFLGGYSVAVALAVYCAEKIEKYKTNKVSKEDEELMKVFDWVLITGLVVVYPIGLIMMLPLSSSVSKAIETALTLLLFLGLTALIYCRVLKSKKSEY